MKVSAFSHQDSIKTPSPFHPLKDPSPSGTGVFSNNSKMVSRWPLLIKKANGRIRDWKEISIWMKDMVFVDSDLSKGGGFSELEPPDQAWQQSRVVVYRVPSSPI